MIRPLSLRARLMLAYAGLIVAGFSVMAVVVGRQILQSAESDYEEKMETQAILVANGLGTTADRLEEGEVTPVDFAALVTSYADQTGARLTIMGLDGKPWLDSTGHLPASVSLAEPEIAAALDDHVATDYRPDPSGQMTYYSAALLKGDEGRIGLVQLSSPDTGSRSVINQRWLELAGGIALIAGAALVASLLLARSLTRPLEALRQSALRLAGGELSHRIESPGSDEIGQLAQAFNHLAARVQAMIDEQRSFASNASHELRTPLTAIRIRSEALRGGRLDEATSAQYIAEIDGEAARLGRLVEDLILLYRFDTGRVELGRETIEPARFARDLARDLEPLLRARSLTLSLDVAEGLPLIHASLGHLKVVFRNLLDNAIKYTPDGGTITWRLGALDGRLVSAITDSGQGISAEDMPHVFERFFRGDKAHSRAVQGVGLGLSLIQSVVRFYGGQVTLDSAGAGRGATARVVWPFGAPDTWDPDAGDDPDTGDDEDDKTG